MKSKCDKCDKPAAIHLTEIVDGKKTEKHLCEECAVAEGIAVKSNVPLAQLLEDFILQTGSPGEGADLKCDVCGMTLADFRQSGLLGCPHDYDAFGQAMEQVVQHTQEGATQHTGKIPRRGGGGQEKHAAVLRLRAELRQAVTAEDYERAAQLRDRIKELEQP